MSKILEISKENRRKILQALFSGAETWEELKKTTKLADATLAKHIKELLKEGLITEEIDPKDRRRKIYRPIKSGLEELREELIAFKLFTFLTEKIYNIWNTYNEEFRKCKGNKKCENEVVNKYLNEICTLIGRFFFLCFPDDSCLFTKTIEYLSDIHGTFLSEIRRYIISQEEERFLTSIKETDTEELLEYVLKWLSGFMAYWKCLAQTTPEEIRQVLEKIYDKKEVDTIIDIFLEEKEKAVSRLKSLENTWIAKMVKIDQSEIPTFEEILVKKISK